jgi:hypothetical protein
VVELKLKEIMQLDMRVKGNMKILREALTRLPFFEDVKPNDIIAEDLEAAIEKMYSKYPVILAYIMRGPNELKYHSYMIRRSDNGNWLTTVSAMSLFEGYAKTCLYINGYIKKEFKKGESE